MAHSISTARLPAGGASFIAQELFCGAARASAALARGLSLVNQSRFTRQRGVLPRDLRCERRPRLECARPDDQIICGSWNILTAAPLSPPSEDEWFLACGTPPSRMTLVALLLDHHCQFENCS